MEDNEDYEPKNLREKSQEELLKLYMDYIEEKEAIDWFNSLDIYDNDGNLNMGWECFED
jgi:hypothetical protein